MENTQTAGAIGTARPAPLDVARRIVDVIADHKGEDIVLLDVGPHTLIADYFVICSGTSERQLRALEEELQKTLRDDGIRPIATEGTPASGWVLMDFSDVIVHLFAPAQREYYRLERLWADAQPVLRIQ